MLVRHAGEIVDFDLLEIKQQIADAKNKIEVATVNDFVNHRPVSQTESFNVAKPAVEEVILPPTTTSVQEANELDADDRTWDVPESVATSADNDTSGAAAAATALVKGKRK